LRANRKDNIIGLDGVGIKLYFPPSIVFGKVWMRPCFKGKACTNEIFSISLEIGANINSEPYRQPKPSVNTLDTGMELFNFQLGFPLAPAVRPKRSEERRVGKERRAGR